MDTVAVEHSQGAKSAAALAQLQQLDSTSGYLKQVPGLTCGSLADTTHDPASLRPKLGGEAGRSRTIVHVFEPLRDHCDEIIDFRLTFSPTDARKSTLSFEGMKLVECGPSVAPGEIFHTLKRVLDTGEPLRTVTRHSNGGIELFFHQTAVRVGDTVVTTTSIVTPA